MISIAILRASVVVVLTLVLIPIYLLGLILDYFFGKRLVVSLIKKLWSRAVMKIIGVGRDLIGSGSDANIFVSNHISWIDILAINSTLDVVFIAKNEVRSWPGLGLLAVLGQTIFIERKSLKSLSQKQTLDECLKKGQSVFFFPEGTSTDGSNVKRFKSSLFEVCYSDFFKKNNWGSVQPITIIYKSPITDDPSFYSFWREEDTIFANIRKIIKRAGQGRVRLVFHRPLQFSKYRDRKNLSNACFKTIKNGLANSAHSF